MYTIGKGGEYMTLHVIKGRSGSGKTKWLQQAVTNELTRAPLGDEIFVIVPDQMSYATEYNLTSNEHVQGLVRAQVLTFKRLAWYILQQIGGVAREQVSGYGYRMLIRQLLLTHKEEFSLFRQAAGKRGFTEEIEQLLQEFSRYAITSEVMHTLYASLTASGAPHTLLSKVKDLTVIVETLEQRLGTTYIDSEGFYPLLTEHLASYAPIRNATIYIDGFTAFTARELALVTALMQQAKDVYITLPFETIEQANDDQALFHEAAYTAQRLFDIAAQHNIPVAPVIHCEAGERFTSTALAHIEQQFEQHQPTSAAAQDHVQIIEATSRVAEVHAIAREIVKLTQQGVRYNEIAILYRQAAVYDPLITTIFPQYQIPVFTNTKKPMLHHPLIEFTRSVLEALVNDWQYEPMFRAVKTDLFFPLTSHEGMALWRERGDRLENFCLAYGIYGKRWFEDSRWFYKKYRGLAFHTRKQTDEDLRMQGEIEAARDIVRTPLANLQNKFEEAKTGRDYATALFVFMEEMQLYDKLMVMRDYEREQYQLQFADEHEQAWRELVAVLDQFVVMFGDEPMTLEEMVALLDEGLEAAEFARIPPTLDEVQVATVDLARLLGITATFVIGVNEGVYPQKIEYEGLLSDNERDYITAAGFELAPTSTKRLLQEDYLVYSAFVSPSTYLYVTYATADEESKALLPSLYVNKLEKMLTDVHVMRVAVDPTELATAVEPLSYLYHPRPALAYMMRQLQQQAPLTEAWQALYDYYVASDLWRDVFLRTVRPLEQTNEAERLQLNVVEGLYQATPEMSISRIEKFYSCPFSYFATYGLKLEERPEYRLEAYTIGDLFHEVLSYVAKHVEQQQLSWSALSKAALDELATTAMAQMAPLLAHNILRSSARYQYIETKLLRVIKRTLHAIGEQAKYSAFTPIAIEAAFGPREKLVSPEFALAHNKKLQLKGRIDRIDATTIDGKKYLRVIDYKSSSRDVDLSELYHGLSLQVITYLDVALSNAEVLLQQEGLPAGMLYMHIQNPLLKYAEEVSQERIASDRLSEFKLSGFVTDDKKVLLDMDNTLEQYEPSKIIPVKINKSNKQLASTSYAISEQDFDDLRKFSRRKHQEAGNAIWQGDIRIAPFEHSTRTSCEYCAYKALCQFDVTDGKQQYRKLPKYKRAEALQAIKEDVANDTNETDKC